MTPLPIPIPDLPTRQDAFLPLLAASETEGLRFVRRLLDEWLSGLNTFSARGEVLLATFDESRMVGVCGLTRDPFTTEPNVGRLRHLYVLPTERGRGIGSALTRHVIALAIPTFQLLRLRTHTSAAARFYENLGFTPTRGDATCTHTYLLPLSQSQSLPLGAA